MGHGLLENTKEECVAHEMDFLLIELKAIEAISNLHKAQLLTYMKLAKASIGLIINFNVKLLKDGIRKYTISNFSALSASSCVNS